MELHGAVVVVTGASSGIGAATASRFGAAGSRVVLAARRLERLEANAAAIRAGGGEALAVRCDVTVPPDVDALLERTLEAFGRVDVLVNDAGIPGGGPFRGLDAEEIDRVIDVNLRAVMQVTRTFLPRLLEQRSGHVVNVASLAGRFAVPGSTVYSATKHAVVAFSEGLSYELAPLGVRVTTVNPGFVVTEGFPQRGLPRVLLLRLERVADTIVDVVRDGRGPEVSVPRFLAAMQVFRLLTPPLYRWGLGGVARRVLERRQPPT